MRIHPVFGYRSSVNVCMVGYCHGGSHLISMLEALAAQSRKGPHGRRAVHKQGM
eukprot:gene4507-3294_t